MTMSIVLPGTKFRTICFIIDTGSANSYIRKADRAYLNWSDDNNGYIVTGMGKKFLAGKSEDAKNVNIRGINLIGSNFTDQFTLVIDALSQSFFDVETSAVEGVRRFLSCVEAEEDNDEADEGEGVKAIMYQGHPQAVNMVGCVWYIKSCIVWFTNSQIFIWII